jgi:hypothetical protein
MSAAALYRAWLVLRLPALLVIAFVFRHELLAQIERVFDIVGITLTAINVLSTPASRTLVFVVVVGVLAAGFPLLASRRLIVRVFVVGLVSAVMAGVTYATRSPLLPLLLAAAILGANAIAGELASAGRKILGGEVRLIGIGVGLSEVFLSSRYLASLVGGPREPDDPLPRAYVFAGFLVSTVMAMGLWVGSLDRAPLLALERQLRDSGAVTLLERGNFNWIAVDAASQHLFVTGHGVSHLRRYPIQGDGLGKPQAAGVETHGAQGFGYDEGGARLFLFDRVDGAIQVIDAVALVGLARYPVPELSPGDPWVEYEPRSRRLIIASEADETVGVPFMILDADTGRVVYEGDDDPGNLLISPERPVVYLSFFRRTLGIAAMDAASGERLAYRSFDTRFDRMAYDRGRDELLVTTPIGVGVLRLDPRTLEPRGELATGFGTRVLAVDEQRRLLVSATLATGLVEVRSLDEPGSVARVYVGPWLRSVVLAEESGVAYVSSNGALYAVDYLSAWREAQS